MNQEKIGKFIPKCRQEKNFTQEENIYKYTKELKKTKYNNIITWKRNYN